MAEAQEAQGTPATDASGPVRDIIVCCDGTGNEVGRNASNVVKFYRCLDKAADQIAYYDPGVGTLAMNAWQRWTNAIRRVLGLAIGWGLDENVLDAYRLIAETYRAGDRIWLFGFSRGAHTARVVAALIEVVGLLRPEQLNLASYALSAYKRTPVRDEAEITRAMRAAGLIGDEIDDEGETPGRYFGRVAGARRVPIRFVGVWDTVSSVIVPWSRLGVFPRLEILPFTRRNPSVEVFRQAAAIDERRCMFRLDGWIEGPFDPTGNAAQPPLQNVKQVWFAGYHSDIGGGLPEEASAAAKYPLGWMIAEAAGAGLRFDPDMVAHFVDGTPSAGQPASRNQQVARSEAGPLHNSMKPPWWPLEFIPKLGKWRQWKPRRIVLGFYLPRSEPRPIAPGARVHESAIARHADGTGYAPENWPDAPVPETDAQPQSTVPEPPPPRPPAPVRQRRRK